MLIKNKLAEPPPLTFKAKPQEVLVCVRECLHAALNPCDQTEKDIASLYIRLPFSTFFVLCFSADCFHIANGFATRHKMRGPGILGSLH